MLLTESQRAVSCTELVEVGAVLEAWVYSLRGNTPLEAYADDVQGMNRKNSPHETLQTSEEMPSRKNRAVNSE